MFNNTRLLWQIPSVSGREIQFEQKSILPYPSHIFALNIRPHCVLAVILAPSWERSCSNCTWNHNLFDSSNHKRQWMKLSTFLSLGIVLLNVCPRHSVSVASNFLLDGAGCLASLLPNIGISVSCAVYCDPHFIYRIMELQLPSSINNTLVYKIKNWQNPFLENFKHIGYC